MDKRQIRQLEMLQRVRDFGTAHGDRFPASSRAARSFSAVADAVRQITEHATFHVATMRRTMEERAAARASLEEALEVIARTASVIEGEADFNNTFQLPRRRPSHTLLMLARLFVRDAAKVTALFIEHALPETFVSDLEALIDRFERAFRNRERGRMANAGERVRVAAVLAAGMAETRRLDVMVTNHLRKDPGITGRWRHDSRVRYPKYRKEHAAPAASKVSAVGGAKAHAVPQTTAVGGAETDALHLGGADRLRQGFDGQEASALGSGGATFDSDESLVAQVKEARALHGGGGYRLR